MRRILLPLLVALAALVTIQDARADRRHQVRYVGIHPIPQAQGGGFCNIEGPHVHIYASNKLEYRDHHGQAYFVGDPVAYGYDGPKTAYKGAHPIHVEAVVEDDPAPDVVYCYINGPHYHYFAPPEGPDFAVRGDAYFYVGTPPPVMVSARPQYVEINAMYTPIVYARPVVEVEAPVGWIGLRADFGFVAPAAAVVVEPPPPPHVHAGVEVHAGIGVVVPPPPRIEVGVGVHVGVGGGVIVGGAPGPSHGKFKHKKFKGKKRHW